VTLKMTDVDIKNVTIVSKLSGLVRVKANLQGHNSNDRHSNTEITREWYRKNADYVLCCNIYGHI